MLRTRQLPTGHPPLAPARREALPGPPRVLELQRTIGNRRTTRLLQRVVHPLDVASELVGRKFTLQRAFKAGAVDLPAGTAVVVESWTNGSPTARVKPDGGGAAFDLPKTLLRHAEAKVAGITHYDAGLDTVVRAYERGAKRIADERARSGGGDAAEIAELEALQKNRQKLLDERLIQETMFNRFDASIKKWVDHYGAKLGFTGKKALDPEIVKSMLFEETQMGTEGAHLDVPASNAIRTRFNIGQGPIDSGAITMVHILREEAPALFALHKLDGIEKAMSDAQDELARLKKQSSLNAAEQARMADLEFMSGPGNQNWENFLWNFKGPGAAKTLFEVATEWLEAPAGTPRKFDYDFWIQAMVRLLFLKRAKTRDWSAAVKAFNGAGQAAANYRTRVMERLERVKAAAKGKKAYAADNL
jgi:hypothetical protein